VNAKVRAESLASGLLQCGRERDRGEIAEQNGRLDAQAICTRLRFSE